MYDLIIIGAGPAGITASVYAARKNINFLVITKDIGGQAAISGDVENYTGYQFISGPELAYKFEEHMRKYNIEVREGQTVLNLKKVDDAIDIQTDKADYQARCVIISSGKCSRQLNIPGEVKFKNKGVTYCATCDGPLFSGKDVAVIGGGNSALDAALQLMNIARHTYLININKTLGGDEVMRQKVINSDRVTVLNSTSLTAISGKDMVESINIISVDAKKELAVGGVFVEIGLDPNSAFAKDVEKNELGEIKIDSKNMTNIPGIFAAGDVTDVAEKQIIIAAGEGSKAALRAFRFLAEHSF